MSSLHREPFLEQLEVAHTEEDCPICHETMTEPRKTPCNHAFCLECLTTWCASHNTCPNCRTLLFQELSKDPAFVHLVAVREDGEEGEHMTIDRRDTEAIIVISGHTLPPITWRFVRDAADRPDELSDEEDEGENEAEENEEEHEDAVQATTDGEEVVLPRDGIDQDAANTTLQAVTNDVAGLEIAESVSPESVGSSTTATDAGESSDQDADDAATGPHTADEHDTDEGDSDSDPGSAEDRDYLEVERLNFHLDAEVDEDIIKYDLYYIWCTPYSKLTPDLEEQALIDANELLPRALAVLLYLSPNRLWDTVENLFTWEEVCRKDWVTMAQYLEYKLQELQNEKEEWSGRDLKAELLTGWEAEMTPDEVDIEPGDETASTEDPKPIDQQAARSPRVPEYSERVLAYYNNDENATFSADVDRLFDCVVHFAQNHYKGLPYENWPYRDDSSSEGGNEGSNVAEIEVEHEDMAGDAVVDQTG